MRVLAILALCLAAVTAAPRSSQRIVGGEVTTIDQYPSMAALMYTYDWNNFVQDCGGSILNNRAILTAAQCLVGEPVHRFRIRVGSTYANSGGVVHNVAQNIIHPQYNVGGRFNNDIAILHVTSAFTFNDNVRAGSIAGANYNVADNQAVWAVGWGTTDVSENVGSEELRHVQVVIINQDTCKSNYEAAFDLVVTDNMICSGWPYGGRDQCKGDSGGPLYHYDVVVGVSSFGVGCADPRFPGVNTRVSRYTAWITGNA